MQHIICTALQGRIRLGCFDESNQVWRQAILDLGLRPIDAKAPVTGASGGRDVLLKDDCTDASLSQGPVSCLCFLSVPSVALRF